MALAQPSDSDRTHRVRLYVQAYIEGWLDGANLKRPDVTIGVDVSDDPLRDRTRFYVVAHGNDNITVLGAGQMTPGHPIQSLGQIMDMDNITENLARLALKMEAKKNDPRGKSQGAN